MCTHHDDIGSNLPDAESREEKIRSTARELNS